MTTAPWDDIERIAASTHQDPHAILGPHPVDGDLIIRAFRPRASAITVVPDDASVRALGMERIHAAGVFEARLPGVRGPLAYTLEVQHGDGVHRARDPYAFASSLGELDLHLAAEGRHEDIYRHLGSHVREIEGVLGTSFAVWAPNAARVSVTGDFSNWDGRLYAMRRLGTGFWEIFIPGVREGALYKYEIITKRGERILKADPYGQAMELRPDTASRVYRSRYEFTDAAWMERRASAELRERPMSIYEVHLGSWRRAKRKPGEEASPPVGQGDRWLTYRELAHELVDYVADLGFTHIELLPIMEHPYDGSWGYQVSGYFAPTSRYGEPDDLRYFIDRCHARGIGVLLDWTPAHFPKDAFALGRFDGTALYEHWDPRLGEHRQWQTYVFHYGRFEVKNFLLSNALYWLREFHADGLRVDAVASMLYLDYGASHRGEWVPNKYGGRENLDAVVFLQELCQRVHERVPGAVLCAEESTTWPGVTRATYLGGLGFDFKWNMGWMHDTLDYFSLDPIHRTFHHNRITFGMMYAYSERYLLPFSHDEVVHLKKSLLSKMPGNRWKMHASLRALYGYMWAHPGKKLLFMGGEIGQWSEWNEAVGLEWELLGERDHAGLQRLIRDLNALSKRYPALYELDDDPEGFLWIDANDSSQSVASFLRFAAPKPAPPEAAEETPPVAEKAAVAEQPTATETLAAPETPAAPEALVATEAPAATEVPGAPEVPAGTEAPAATEVPAASETPAAVEPANAAQSHQKTPGPLLDGKPPAITALPTPRAPQKKAKGSHIVFIGNFTPLPRYDYRVGVPRLCRYLEVLNTDGAEYGGSGLGNFGAVEAQPVPCHGYPQSVVLTLPPLGDLFLVPESEEDPPATPA